MAYTVDREIIFNKMVVNKMPFYKVLDSDGKTVMDIQDDEDVTVEEAQARLRDTLEALRGLITVVLSDYSGRQKGAGGNKATNVRYTIKLTDDESRSAINGPGALQREDTIRAAIEREYQAKYDALKEKYEHKLAMQKMQDQIDKLNSGDQLEKYLPIIAGIFGNTPGAVAGIPGEPHITGPGQAKERLAAAINRILKVDPDFVSNLERLADLAEKNPTVYKMAIEQLKSL